MTPTPEQIEAALKAYDDLAHYPHEPEVAMAAALTAAAEVGRDEDVVVEGTKEGLDLFRKIERNHTIERCAQAVPTNWCDSLLTGNNAPKHPLDNRGVEALLRGIQDRIRALKDKPLP